MIAYVPQIGPTGHSVLHCVLCTVYCYSVTVAVRRLADFGGGGVPYVHAGSSRTGAATADAVSPRATASPPSSVDGRMTRRELLDRWVRSQYTLL